MENVGCVGELEVIKLSPDEYYPLYGIDSEYPSGKHSVFIRDIYNIVFIMGATPYLLNIVLSLATIITCYMVYRCCVFNPSKRLIFNFSVLRVISQHWFGLDHIQF